MHIFNMRWFHMIVIIINKRLFISAYSAKQTIEEIFDQFSDEKNAAIAVSPAGDSQLYEDFYEELDNWMDVSNSMNIIYFGPAASFMRLDVESILHIFQKTKKQLIPISKAQLAWNLVTDGKTAAYLQGREFLAFGSLLNVVPEEDLFYVNFGDPSVLGYFASYLTELSSRKYGVLAAAYKRYFGDRWYTNRTIINDMGYLICGFPSDDIARITPDAFMDINVQTFAKVDRCNVDQIKTLYNIAVHHDAYGSPVKWSSHEITHLGHLVAYLPEEQIPQIQLEAIPALTPEILKLMDQRKLIYFTMQQIFRMRAKTRRILVLKLQLMRSLDVSLMLKDSATLLSFRRTSIFLFVVSVVNLLIK